jgi:FkbM family methyltransferase
MLKKNDKLEEEFLEDDEQESQSQDEQFFLWEYLQEAGKPIVLYGTGDGAEKILSVMERYELEPICFAVSGDFGAKPDFRGYKVLPFEEVEKRYSDFVVLVCFGSERDEVIEMFHSIAAEYEVFVPDLPVTSDGELEIYTPEYIEANREKLDKVHKLFADDKSREVFDGWLQYRLSGRLDVLERLASPRDELLSLLKINKAKHDEFFIDAGAFKGDTVDEFLELVGQKGSESKTPKFKKIIAIEPDIKNYTTLRRKFYAYGKEIFCPVNAAAWSENRQLEFIVKSGKAGLVGDSAVEGSDRKVRTRQIEAVKIDSLVSEDDKPTLIKIDVEGAEAEVLGGARTVITRHRPKMLVSLYHRTEDMFFLPLLVQSFSSRYKLYLRKTRCIPGWEFQLICV